jgi:hypothetical protein
VLAKIGRPPKNKPSIEPIAPAAWDRLKRLAQAKAIDPVLGSELGRLANLGELTSTQLAAGVRVGEIYGRFERVVGKRRSTKSPSYEMGFSAGGSSAISEETIASAKAAWKSLQEILSVYPSAVRSVLEELCVEDRAINSALLEDVRTLLDRLAFKFGITTKSPEPQKKKVRAEKSDQATAGTNPRAPNLEQACYVTVLSRLRPDLKPTQIVETYFTFKALTARAVYRRDVETRKRRTLNHVSVVALRAPGDPA